MEVSLINKGPAQQVRPTNRPEAVQQAQQREAAKPKEPEPAKAAQAKPRPIVNTQGHTTGRLVNYTA